MKILLTIAARGGSKGVKNKNIRPLCGKPLIAITIEQARAWGKASRIVVSTDSEEIATVARTWGVEVPVLRPSDLATDSAPKVPVLRHALVSAEQLHGETYDIVMDLDPTAPIRSTTDLDAALAQFQRARPHTLFSVVPAHKNPYFNMVEVNTEGLASLCKRPPAGVSRRQDAPSVYALNASIYIYSRDYLMNAEAPAAITDRSVAYVMDEKCGVDIDREIDFKFIEFLVREGLFTI